MGLAAGAIIMDEGKRQSAEEPVYAARTATSPNKHQKVTAITADRSGHFTVATLVNGIHVNMVADTGATLVVLTEDDARRAGIDPGWLTYDVPVSTANGQTHTARVTLDEIRVGSISLTDVEALIAKENDLSSSLLGMSFIGRLQRFELKGDQLVLHQ